MWFRQQSAWHSGIGPEFGPIAPMGEKKPEVVVQTCNASAEKENK